MSAALRNGLVEHNLPVSAQITLERTDNPDELIIELPPAPHETGVESYRQSRCRQPAL